MANLPITIQRDGGVTSPQGFATAAVAAGIKQSGRPDLVLVTSDRDCTAAGVFTQNQVAAAPVIVDRATLTGDDSTLRGVVINAGNANACTGEPGLDNAREMQGLAASMTGHRPEQFLVMSTGVIGVQLPMDRLRAGIAAAAQQLSPANGGAAAKAIMTTDTRPKHLAATLDLPDGRVTIGGMAKGAGMMHPDMATLLGLLTTDASVPAADLREMLQSAVEASFNTISIDGDTSTNDTILLLANGANGIALDNNTERAAFEAALTAVCRELAMMVVRDGEGVTKVVQVRVTGAQTAADARRVADTIATSPLVKTAFAGGDPNWGRVMMATGRSGVELDQARLALWIGVTEGTPLQLASGGTPAVYYEADAARIFAAPEFWVRVDLGLGAAEASVWTTDLTRDYVTINSDYRT